MNIAIVGFGVEGTAAFKYWSQLGALITICDEDASKSIPEGTNSQLGPDYLKNLDRFDVVFRTNGIHPDILLRENPGIADKLTTSVNEFFRVSPTKNVIGVTGTKGKGTTSTLITKMLEAAGKKVFLGGNIGISAFDLLPKLDQNSWVVLELSSFQLIDLRYSPHIGVCLMIVPEHLNWHADMDEYTSAKSNLFKNQIQSDVAIYFANNELSKQIASVGQGQKLPYFADPGAKVVEGNIVIAGQTVCATNELKLLGEFNWQNVCAAVTATWQATQDVAAIRSVLTTFSGLEHRLELVREVKGIRYYDDSFAATPDAAIAALSAIKGPKVVIMGGFDRNLPLEHLAQAAVEHNNDIRKVVTIGASNKRLAEELEKAGFSNYLIENAKSMAEIVAIANTFATRGDAVLLSPGFSSFDMFKNFTDRGEQFKATVEAL